MNDILPLPDNLLLARYRIGLTPEAPLGLQGEAGGILRGGFGLLLKEGVCLRPDGHLCQGRCQQAGICSYAYLFEGVPMPDAQPPSGYSAVPQPFVLAPQLPMPDVLAAGEPLTFGLLLAGQAIWHFPYLLAAFRALGVRGLGRERVRARLSEAVALLPDGEVPLYDSRYGRLLGNQPTPVSAAGWGAGQAEDRTRLTLRFVTPARLKHQDRFVTETPEFHVVVRTLLRRLSSLAVFHGGERWDIDYAGWIERAKAVQIDTAHVFWRDRDRYSTLQKRHMNFGGVLGVAVYQGEVAPFLPLLRLGQLIHVGKGAVFGNGRYEIVNGE